jgi:hypothetical protein
MDEDYIGASTSAESLCGVLCGVGGIACGLCIFLAKSSSKATEI